MTHYDELGVSPRATPVEIRRAYLALARRFHPDRLHGASAQERASAAARMARVNAAWTVLSDGKKRAAYDATLSGDTTAGAGYVRDVGDTWQPFDTGPDEVDPRLLDDTPTGATAMRRSLTMLPAAAAVAGVVLIVLGFMVGFPGLLLVGLGLVAGSALSFLVIPLIALAKASRADHDR